MAFHRNQSGDFPFGIDYAIMVEHFGVSHSC
jgi:hypothetical protein